MAKTKISEWSTTPANNTDIDGINIAEGCAPSGINDAIRDLMAQVRSWQSGASADPFNGPMNGTIGATTAYSGAFTTLSASGTTTLSGLTASTALALDASKNVVSVANTGSGSNVLATSPTLVTPALGTPSSATLTNATGLPISTGVSGLGTGVATALAVNVGSAGAPVVNGGALGTPSSGTVTNLTGTASININGTVGATTPTTGAFTTTTVSTSETLSYGTANGVTYLNGSKVLTSGSALTFDGSTLVAPQLTTTADVNGITTLGRYSSGYAWTLIRPSSTATGIEFRTHAGDALYQLDQSSGANKHIWYTGASEQMRLTSTGLGIGTSSPTQKLSVQGAGRFYRNAASTIGAVASSGLMIDGAGSNGNISQIGFGYDATVLTYMPAAIYGITTTQSGNTAMAIGFATRNVTTDTAPEERMRLDSAGNLGIGVTPSAWASPLRPLQIFNASLAGHSSDGTAMYLSANSYFDTSFKYISTGIASQYRQQSGIHSWYTAASGTAGNAISFTQAMTLDASGNLLVGTTSASGVLTLEGANTSDGATAKYIANIRNSGAQTSGIGAGIAFTQKMSSFYATLATIQGIKENATSDNYASALSFYTRVNGADLTERARIDSSGNLLVGVSSFTNSSGGAKIGNSGRLEISSTTTASSDIAYWRNANGIVGAINISGSATTYATSSDYRLKNSVAPMTGALAKVAQLKPCTYKWNADGSDGEGFIAHELAEVCPHAVTGEKDAVDEEGNPKYQGIDTSFLVATLTAAIQEQQAIIESLKARLDAANL